jgi:pimeloyl-ACP methyl ester carboxylesterase
VPVPVDDDVLCARVFEEGPGRPVLLVHGLSSNARLWDGVAAHLAAAGHPVAAVDLRGHGASAAVPDAGPDPTRTAAADLAAVCAGLGWERPVVAGQSWGGNVVLQLAGDRPDLVAALVLVDGGWLHLGDRFADLGAAWEVLAPPRFDTLTAAALRDRLAAAHPDWSVEAVAATLANLRERPDGTVEPWLDRARHRRIVASLLAHSPRTLYPAVSCPVRLLTADPERDRELLAEAVAGLGDAAVVPMPGDHDLHAQFPDRVAAEIARAAATAPHTEEAHP